MSAPATATVKVPLDCIDELAQIRDELQVVWCALGNPVHAEDCLVQIGEHVNGLHHRVYNIVERMKGTTSEPVRLVGGDRDG